MQTRGLKKNILKMSKGQTVVLVMDSDSIVEEEVVVITESMFDAMILGNAVCIGGVWAKMQEKSEKHIVESIENKWMKECGFDGETEEEK